MKTPRNGRFFLFSTLHSEKTEGVRFHSEKGEGIMFFTPKKLRVLRGLEPKKPRVSKVPRSLDNLELAAVFAPFPLFILQGF